MVYFWEGFLYIFDFRVKNNRYIIVFLGFFIILFATFSTAQKVDSVTINIDDLKIQKDTTSKTDLSKDPSPKKYKISKDAITDTIKYSAKDSMRFVIPDRKLYLYGDAKIEYDDNELEAPYITLDGKTNIAKAESTRDSTRKVIDNPVFRSKEGEFEAVKFEINTKTKQGFVNQLLTKQDDLFIHGEQSKIITKNDSTGVKENIFMSKNALITTCPCEIGEVPDYGIRSTKQKIYTDRKLAIIGPSYLEIKGVPTPLVLPFGFFPLSSNKRSGLLIPNDYGFRPSYGYGLQGIGYYWSPNDKIAFSTTADIYTRGSWGLSENIQYKKRYKYSGGLRLDYSTINLGDRSAADFSLSKSFLINWNHSQDAKAHPYNTFSANLQIQNRNHLSNNFTDANNQLNQQLTSSVNFRRNFPSSPVTFTAGFRHSQNTQSGDIKFNFPDLALNVNTFYPFRVGDKNPGKVTWYEKIGINYNTNFKNEWNTTDTTIFDSNILEDSKFGLDHNLSTSGNYTVLKYLNLTPSINYKEVWYFRELNKTYDPSLLLDSIYNATGELVQVDTTFGSINDNQKWNFERIPTTSFSLSSRTNLYGMLNLNDKGLKAVRHVMTPSINYSYSPDYSSRKDKYDRTVSNVDSRFEGATTYTTLDGAIFGTPSSAKSSRINFSINNSIEAKFSNRDSTKEDKKIKLIRQLNIGGNYDFNKDSIKLSTINFSANNSFLFDIINFNWNMTADPYVRNENGQNINRFLATTKQGLFRVNNANYSFNTSLSWNKIKDVYGKISSINKETAKESTTSNTQKHLDAFIKNLTVSHNFIIRRSNTIALDTTQISTHEITISNAQFAITDKWKIGINRLGYDFTKEIITFPDFSFYRDLNCWEMEMRWQPRFNTYNFSIRVKPSTLGFINLPQKKNRFDPQLNF